MSLEGNKIVIAEVDKELASAMVSNPKCAKSTIEVLILDYVKKNIDVQRIITQYF